MGYSVEGLLIAFPDGLRVYQMKSLLKQAGYEVGRKELLETLTNSTKCIQIKGRWFINSEEKCEDQKINKELSIAVRDLTKSLKSFLVVVKKKQIQMQEDSDWNESSDSDSNEEDKMPRKFWMKKPIKYKDDARARQH